MTRAAPLRTALMVCTAWLDGPGQRTAITCINLRCIAAVQVGPPFPGETSRLFLSNGGVITVLEPYSRVVGALNDALGIL